MTKWNIDSSHSGIEFRVKHMAIATVRGSFNKLEGSIYTENGKLSRIEASIDPASINTNDAQRDGHLRSADFFDVENYPSIKFESTAIESLGNGSYRITGDLDMHGQTHPVTFEADVSEAITDPYGLTRSGASASGKLNRKQWGLNWNQVLELGGVMVGEEIRFNIDLEATVEVPKEAPAAA